MNQRDWDAAEEAAGFLLALRIVGRAVLLFVAVAVACVTPTELPAPTLTLTPNPNMIVGIGSHGSPDEAAIMQRLGVKHVRVSYYMKKDSEHERAMFRLRLIDLRTHGLEPLVVVPDGFSGIVPTISFAREFVDAELQIGNELDNGALSPVSYASLMRTIVDSVPRGQFVGMGLASTDGQVWAKSPDAIRQAKYLDVYLAAGGPILSAWAIHCYGRKLSDAIESRVIATQAVLRHRMPLIITEVGIDSAWIAREDPLMPDDLIDLIQAQESTDAIETAKRLGVDRMYFYQLFTADATSRAENFGFGFLRADAKTTRPVFDAVRDAIGGGK